MAETRIGAVVVWVALMLEGGMVAVTLAMLVGVSPMTAAAVTEPPVVGPELEGDETEKVMTLELLPTTFSELRLRESGIK